MLISYAQNFEDVILWRALNHIERGFYVDLGAQDPVRDSVSLFFYEAGWRGVHVEPSPHFAAKLRAARPDEEVIGAVVGRNSGLIKFYESITTGLSTGDPLLAEQHTANGFEFQEISAPSVTLAQVLDGYGEQEIHWLKVDVEGFEAAVIDSWLPSTVRPWIVVVESVKPTTHEPTFAEWEPKLLGLGYDFVYFDGLNRFYLSEQHPELAHAFGPGPNVFDGFVLSGDNSNTFASRLDREIANHCEAEHKLATKLDQFELATRGFQEQLAEATEARLAAREQFEFETRALQEQLVEAARAGDAAHEQFARETRAYQEQLADARRASADARQQHERETRALEQQLGAAGRANAEARQQLEARVAELDANARRWLNAATNLQLEVAGLRGSASWRITAPLRWVHSKSVVPLRALGSWGRGNKNESAAFNAAPSSPASGQVTIPLSRSARIVYAQLEAARRK